MVVGGVSLSSSDIDNRRAHNQERQNYAERQNDYFAAAHLRLPDHASRPRSKKVRRAARVNTPPGACCLESCSSETRIESSLGVSSP